MSQDQQGLPLRYETEMNLSAGYQPFIQYIPDELKTTELVLAAIKNDGRSAPATKTAHSIGNALVDFTTLSRDIWALDYAPSVKDTILQQAADIDRAAALDLTTVD